MNYVNDSKHLENAFFHIEFKLILIFQIKAYNTFSIIYQSRVYRVHWNKFKKKVHIKFMAMEIL